MAPVQQARPGPSRISRKSSIASKGLFAAQHRLSIQGPSFVKALEFPADGPGRVIVRLERLMGSDRIRITDTKYMATLLQRLQEEEEITWQKRTRERRKAEHNRFRQLVIDGYTDPTPEMEDLFNHPVFRVNRILNRLSRLNQTVTPSINLPPIIPIDPFKLDDTGHVFKSYPGHFRLAKGTDSRSRKSIVKIVESFPQIQLEEAQDDDTQYINVTPEIAANGSYTALEIGESWNDFETEKEDEETAARENRETDSYLATRKPKSTKHIKLSASTPEKRSEGIIRPSAASVERISGQKLANPSIEKQSGHIAFSVHPSETKMSRTPSKADSRGTSGVETDTEAEKSKVEVLTLQEIQRKYGVAPNTDLGVQWKPYQSPIVETVLHDAQGVRNLYEMGTEVADMYDRQQQTADEYIESLRRKEENERILYERSMVNNEDDGKEEEVEDINDRESYVFEHSEIEEYGEEQGLVEGEAEVPLELEPSFYQTSDIVVSPTWDNLEESWEDEETELQEEYEDLEQD